MKRLQELRELGIQPTTPKMSVIQQQSPITTTITDSQAPLPVISDRTVSSTTVDVPPRSHTPESEGLCSYPYYNTKLASCIETYFDTSCIETYFVEAKCFIG